ncbi:MAG TPA: LamG domain-containing protein [Gemmatales bacterium]|nr:LamG domain-containing protein [Gemmatales bacterium]
MAVIVCPGCSGQLQVPDVTTPTPGQCPRCQSKFLIPPVSLAPGGYGGAVPAGYGGPAPGGYGYGGSSSDTGGSAETRSYGRDTGKPPLPPEMAFSLAVLVVAALLAMLSPLTTIYLAVTGPGAQQQRPQTPEAVAAQLPPAPGDGAAAAAGDIVVIFVAVTIMICLLFVAYAVLSAWAAWGSFSRNEAALYWARSGLPGINAALFMVGLIGFFASMQLITNMIGVPQLLAAALGVVIAVPLRSKGVDEYMGSRGTVPNSGQALAIFVVSVLGLLGVSAGLGYLLPGPDRLAPQAPHDPRQFVQRETKRIPAGAGGAEQPKPEANQPDAGRGERDAPPVERPARPDPPDPARPFARRPQPEPPAKEVKPPENPAALPGSLADRADERITRMPQLIAYYSFEEDDGPQFFDASPFRHHATGFDVTRVQGRRGKAIRFDGTASIARLPNVDAFDLPADGGGAICFWFRAEEARGWMVCLRGDDRQGNYALWRVGFNVHGTLNCQIRDSSVIWYPPEVSSDREAVTKGRWHHVVFNRSGTGTLELWLDGILISASQERSAQRGPRPPALRGMKFLRREMGTDSQERMFSQFTGDLDEVCIFRRYLERDEIAGLYNVADTSREIARQPVARPESGGSAPNAGSGSAPRDPAPAPAPRDTGGSPPPPPPATTPATPPDTTPSADGLPAAISGKVDTKVLAIPNLLAYYSFAEGSGATAHDAGPHRMHGQITNAEWSGGYKGKGLKFNGRNSFVRLPIGANWDLKEDDEFATSLWFRTKTPRGVLFSLRGGEQASNAIFMSFFDTSRNLIGFVRPTEGRFPVHARVFPAETRKLQDGNWHHFVLNRRSDGRTAELWIDGMMLASSNEKPSTPSDSSMAHCIIGADWIWATSRPESWPWFEGDIDEVAFFRRALTAEDIETLRGKR